MPPTTHARLGASSSKRWMNCPGSVALSEGIPDSTSKYATEGTAAHELAEKVLFLCIEGEPTPASSFIDETIAVDEDGEEVLVLVTEEMAAAVQVFVDYVLARLAALREEHGSVEIYLERTFDLGPLDPPEPMFGTADVTIWGPSIKHLEVIDYKHGQGVVVEVEENSQIMMYGLGATVSQGTIPDSITVTIVQPRVDHPDGFCRSYDFGRDRLIEFKHELFSCARATQEENAPLAVGDWCRFCNAKAVCPAQLEHAHSTVMVEFMAEPDDELEELLPDPKLLDPTQVAMVVDRAAIIMDWLRDVEAHALTTLQQGGNVPGYKLVSGRSNRRWRDEEKAHNFLARNGIKMNERTTRKLVSPNQAEGKLKAAGLDPSKLERYWEKPEGKPKLARTDDPRPALPPAVEQTMAAFETEPDTGPF